MFLHQLTVVVPCRYKAALSITSLVTFIAAYHYFRIFNSWVDAYAYPPWNGTVAGPQLTGKPFNDAYRCVLFLFVGELCGKLNVIECYQHMLCALWMLIADNILTDRYMDWLLTVPLLLIEIVLCCQLSPEDTADKATKLGVAAALMIIIGYPGELLVEQSEIMSVC